MKCPLKRREKKSPKGRKNYLSKSQESFTKKSLQEHLGCWVLLNFQAELLAEMGSMTHLDLSLTFLKASNN